MTTATQPHYRHMTPADIPQAWDLITVGLNAVRATVNRAPLAKHVSVKRLLEHLLTHDRETCWCIDQDGELLGFCAAAVREERMFLSHFWMHLEQTQHGLGWPLLIMLSLAGLAGKASNRQE